jgi:hypothetical protein
MAPPMSNRLDNVPSPPIGWTASIRGVPAVAGPFANGPGSMVLGIPGPIGYMVMRPSGTRALETNAEGFRKVKVNCCMA